MQNFFISRVKSFKYAFMGLAHVLKYEKNSWIHLIATIFAIGTSFYLKLNQTEWLFIISAIVLVWITELINTVIENTMDLITKEINQKVKVVKDISAGFVLLAALYAIVCAALIFIPKIL